MYKQQRQAVSDRRIDGMSRDEVCLHYQQKVQLMARRLAGRLPQHSSLTAGDLASHGVLGLLEAFDRFEATRGASFNTFAEFRIRGAMMDALRSQDTLTRYRRRGRNQLQESVAALTQELGRPPEPQEVADRMELSLDEYQRLAKNSVQESFQPLHAPAGRDEDSGPTLAETLADDGGDPLSMLLDDELRGELKAALARLDERKRHCIILYYVKDMTLAEIGEVFDVSHSRISQILTAARAELRKSIEHRARVQRPSRKEAM